MRMRIRGILSFINFIDPFLKGEMGKSYVFRYPLYKIIEFDQWSAIFI